MMMRAETWHRIYLSAYKDEYHTWTRFKNIIEKHYMISSNSFLMRKSKIVGWLNDRSKFSSTNSSNSTDTSKIEHSCEIADTILERIASLEDTVKNMTRTVDKKLDILLQKLH